MKKLISIAIFSLLASSVFAKPIKKPLRAPTSVPAVGGFKFEVKYGDKLTEFYVWSDKQGKYFSAAQNGRSNTGNLSEKNYNFLTAESAKIVALPKTSAKSCPTSHMKISAKGGSQVQASCLGAKNKTTQRMAEMANVLSLLL
ncbi:hypothetical protein [Bdellovibrio sp. NC01]|uniref:hypothetical protein n=1 Tax=Bdellovibrio sp. NC01 TaxID=2220073 RepID=UPI001157E743|nr:hypothetical protein [Bdellovibrio sp. NC01]QDK38190.1 hypothetical protein DOE51_11650 [Bdellovibrio sp. NC01]